MTQKSRLRCNAFSCKHVAEMLEIAIRDTGLWLKITASSRKHGWVLIFFANKP